MRYEYLKEYKNKRLIVNYAPKITLKIFNIILSRIRNIPRLNILLLHNVYSYELKTVNFTYVYSNIPSSPNYSVYVTQLIICGRSFSSYANI